MTEPSIFEAAGGAAAFARLTTSFYDRVREHPTLAPVFADFTAEHAANVALWLGEVFGGPPTYSEQHGGHRAILEKHGGLHLTEAHRAAWVALMLDAAREVLPPDPQLQHRFAEYIEWGSHIAVTASQPDFEVRHVGPVPTWTWSGRGGSR
jgi:hemoglobin